MCFEVLSIISRVRNARIAQLAERESLSSHQDSGLDSLVGPLWQDSLQQALYYSISMVCLLDKEVHHSNFRLAPEALVRYESLIQFQMIR